MNKTLIGPVTALLVFFLAMGRTDAWSGTDISYPSDDQEASREQETVPGNERFSTEELNELLAPIALYSDPLIAQILPAATFIEQINSAAHQVRLMGTDALIDQQEWDVSVKAVAHYPELLFMMDRDSDWTVSLGQAFFNQGDDVMQSIQFLRRQARATGALVSTGQQQVIEENGVIRILPAQPDLIYLPDYDSKAVYVEPPTSQLSLITFGFGFAIGSWLNRDCDWHGRRIYYHGWQGRGWINRSRPHVHTGSGVYLGARQTTITTNRHVLRYSRPRHRTGHSDDGPVRSPDRRPASFPDQHPPNREQQRPGKRPAVSLPQRSDVTHPRPDQRTPRTHTLPSTEKTGGHQGRRPADTHGRPTDTPAAPPAMPPRQSRENIRPRSRETATGMPGPQRGRERHPGAEEGGTHHRGNNRLRTDSHPTPAQQQPTPSTQPQPRRQPSAGQTGVTDRPAPARPQRATPRPDSTRGAAPQTREGGATHPVSPQPKHPATGHQPRGERSAPLLSPRPEQRPSATVEKPSRQASPPPAVRDPASGRSR